VKAYDWDGKELTEKFAIDFRAEKLGRPHLMRFGQAGFYAKQGEAAQVRSASAE